MNDRAQAVLDFWFDEMVAEKRFKKDKSFDELIKEKFGEDHNKAINNEYDSWQDKLILPRVVFIIYRFVMVFSKFFFN